MSRVSLDRATLVDTARAVVLAGLSGVTAPAALTSASGAVTVTYTTDNPNITPNGSVTIPDGDIPAASLPSLLEWSVELNAVAAAMYTDISALRTAVNSLVTGTNVFDITALSGPTARAPNATNKLIGVTYTTDNPNITPNNAITVADGDGVTVSNLQEMLTELNKEAYLLRNDLAVTYGAMRRIIEQKSFQGMNALPAMTSNATMVTITYTTDNPNITPNAAVTIADGDSQTVTAPDAGLNQRWEFLVELKDQFQKQRADLLSIYTALDSVLDKAAVA